MTTNVEPPAAEDYNVAWICALPDVELDPARLMLDDDYDTPSSIDARWDDVQYFCGRMHDHRVVIACLPNGESGNVNASRLTYALFRSFANIKIALLVGIGGGVPRPSSKRDPLDEIYLGDVVVGWPDDGGDAVVYHDRGKATANGRFEMRGHIPEPDWSTKQALGSIKSNHRLGKTKFDDHLMRLNRLNGSAMPSRDQDYLFEAGYIHEDPELTCESCDRSRLVTRPERSENRFVFHMGRIATGNSVIKDAERRDKISKDCGGALCIEMEAAGASVNRNILVIRGISDYADSHKNDKWQFHAAKNAAVFARELLCTMRASKVKAMEGPARSAEIAIPTPKPEPESTPHSENKPEAAGSPMYQTQGSPRDPKLKPLGTDGAVELPGSRP
ncbi:kinesin light chain [Diplodia corticola]|uniref:Kinesin light chain n=1 Tax=Diplodia corticola TaxID=236234 RepID=A0A1J9QXN2_9PEZI|nr:kinesin light chain [Diplodia corticola]OJD33137.1 kinesin light chain [Diplodia corticola]